MSDCLRDAKCYRVMNWELEVERLTRERDEAQEIARTLFDGGEQAIWSEALGWITVTRYPWLTEGDE